MSHGASDQAGAPSASCWERLAPPAHWRISKVFQPVQRPLGVDTRRFLIDSSSGLSTCPMLPRGTFVLFLARA